MSMAEAMEGLNFQQPTTTELSEKCESESARRIYCEDAVFTTQETWTKFDPLNDFDDELHINLERWNLEICEHSSFLKY